MKKEFTKADLKDGMVVEYRDLSRRVVIGNSLVGENGYNILDNYNDTLLSWGFSDNDIIKVYEIKKPYPFSDMMKDRNLRLIWNRFNTICMTAEEMRKKLEELTGQENIITVNLTDLQIDRRKDNDKIWRRIRNESRFDGYYRYLHG